MIIQDRFPYKRRLKAQKKFNQTEGVLTGYSEKYEERSKI